MSHAVRTVLAALLLLVGGGTCAGLVYVLADAYRTAHRRLARALADDAFGEDAEPFADIAAALTPDFAHIDIQRLSALYLVSIPEDSS